ncbi:hypothetical protein JX265_005480 [Neoarthrinium moseri]|uniref:Uncharacterized protein n=1 Tax=Neoarthrinium moseri TaxID=1658444 RepID=A0A9Q0ARC5_9PEZI|nr:uncharacterized protein JN550_009301 [Neoarthrinium moseri]KAI1845323.1 hypothetical protein JX266_008633 [Neoarthrinium moseri]KAI1863803.1 hypothetical protein JN550_009301 [Neoarthrinium moseri]KAI1872600.1 hypothetical protein JX265_005480 [Neoarthrinium moseri]
MILVLDGRSPFQTWQPPLATEVKIRRNGTYAGVFARNYHIPASLNLSEGVLLQAKEAFSFFLHEHTQVTGLKGSGTLAGKAAAKQQAGTPDVSDTEQDRD